MNLPTAIEILTSVFNYDKPCWMPDAINAMKLGIEALKFENEHRRNPGVRCDFTLPGETEETRANHPLPLKEIIISMKGDKC